MKLSAVYKALVQLSHVSLCTKLVQTETSLLASYTYPYTFRCIMERCLGHKRINDQRIFRIVFTVQQVSIKHPPYAPPTL